MIQPADAPNMLMSEFRNWFEEKQSSWLYRVMAASEKDLEKRQLFLKLSSFAERQARVWERGLRAQGNKRVQFRPSARARLVALLVRWLGPRTMSIVLTSMKVRGLSAYRNVTHCSTHPMPTSVTEVGRRHKNVAGGNLRAAVFGVNDGLVSNASLVMGMAGAASDASLVILSGVAGLFAGALSMAAGEYVSMRSQRELFECQIDLERAELAVYPEEEAEELALIYAARGMKLAEARRFTRKMVQNPEQALDLLSREELGLNPDELGSPWGAASFSFFAFSMGALIPLLPFFAGLGLQPGIRVAAVLTGTSLFIVGALLSLFTGKSAAWGGLRMLLIGAGAGAATYALGHFAGLSLV